MFELTDPVVHHAEPPLESDSERSWGRTDKGEASWACVRGLPCLYRLCGGPSSDLPLCSPCTLPPPSTCSLSGRRERDQKLFQDARVQCCVSSLESAGLHRVSEIGLAWRCVIWSYGSWRCSRRRAGRDASRDRGGCALLRPPVWRPRGSAVRHAYAAKSHHALGGCTRRRPTRRQGHSLAKFACPRRQDDLGDEPVSAGGGRRVGHGRDIVPGALNGPLRASRRAVVGRGEAERQGSVRRWCCGENKSANGGVCAPARVPGGVEGHPQHLLN